MPLSEQDIQSAAAQLYDAERSRTQIRPLTMSAPDMDLDDAYAIQKAWVDRKIEDGSKVTGYKIGLTSRAMQMAMNIEHPDFGVLLDDMAFPNGGRIRAADFTDPRIEVEFAFVLKTPLFGETVTLDDVVAATDYVVPALELIAARSYRVDPDSGYTRTVFDTIADNAANAGYILGDRRVSPAEIDLPWAGAMLYLNGENRGKPGSPAALWAIRHTAFAGCASGLHRTGSDSNPNRSFWPDRLRGRSRSKPAIPCGPTTENSVRLRSISYEQTFPQPNARETRDWRYPIRSLAGDTRDICRRNDGVRRFRLARHRPRARAVRVARRHAPFAGDRAVRCCTDRSTRRRQSRAFEKVCDIGVQSFLVPMIDTADQAAAVVDAVKYPPNGTRGLGTSLARAARWNRIPGYVHDANDEMCVIVQAETAQALDNLAAIARTDGIDGVFFGPSDLSASMGYVGNPAHPEVVAALNQGIATVRAAGKHAGLLCLDETQIGNFVAAGASFVGVGVDTLLLGNAAHALAARVKDDDGAPPAGY